MKLPKIRLWPTVIVTAAGLAVLFWFRSHSWHVPTIGLPIASAGIVVATGGGAVLAMDDAQLLKYFANRDATKVDGFGISYMVLIATMLQILMLLSSGVYFWEALHNFDLGSIWSYFRLLYATLVSVLLLQLPYRVVRGTFSLAESIAKMPDLAEENMDEFRKMVRQKYGFLPFVWGSIIQVVTTITLDGHLMLPI